MFLFFKRNQEISGSITFKTKRLLLRKLQPGDEIMMFHNWANDQEVCKYLTWTPHQTIEQSKQALEEHFYPRYLKEKNYVWGIVYRKNNQLIGNIDVVRIENDIPEIGYCLSRNYWRKGIMSEALTKISKYLKSLGYQKIKIRAFQENVASNSLIKHFNGQFIGKEKGKLPNLDDKIHDINVYEISL